MEALVARELGGEVAVFPARDVIDEKGVELVFFDGDAEGGVVVLRVHFAWHFGDVDGVFGGAVFRGRGVGELNAFGLLIFGDADGLGVDDETAALEFEVRGLSGETVETEDGGGVEGVAFEDPVGGINLFDGGIGGDFV